MGQEIASRNFSTSDFESFAAHLREETRLVQHWFDSGRFARHGGVGGFELEAWLVDAQQRPAPVNAELIEQVDSGLVVSELAKFNVELNGAAHTLTGPALSAMADDLAATWALCNRAAARFGAHLLMIGILPTAEQSAFDLANMSPLRRYRALNDQVLRLRGGRPMEINIQGRERMRTHHTDLMLEAATTSFQIHLQVPPGQAARFYNAAKILSAPMVAVAANSPFLFGHDLWAETRIPLFEQTVAVQKPGCPSRVTFGTGYLSRSLMECFLGNLEKYPVLLPEVTSRGADALDHLRLHNGTIWRWTRPLIGFEADGTPHLRIEHRVVPAGPTVIDCVANAALFYGLVHALSALPEPLERSLTFTAARRNFYAAARRGLEAPVDWPAVGRCPVGALLAEHLLPLARDGLERLDVDRVDIDTFLGVIAGRVASGRNGAAWQRAYAARRGRDMAALTAAYAERQRSGAPVHEWGL